MVICANFLCVQIPADPTSVFTATPMPVGWAPFGPDFAEQVATLRADAQVPGVRVVVKDEAGEEDPTLAEVLQVIEPDYAMGSRPDLEATLAGLLDDVRVESWINETEPGPDRGPGLEDDDDEDDDEGPGMEATFVGQSNGLCGAAAPGELSLVTGLYTGEVGARASLADQWGWGLNQGTGRDH